MGLGAGFEGLTVGEIWGLVGKDARCSTKLKGEVCDYVSVMVGWQLSWSVGVGKITHDSARPSAKCVQEVPACQSSQSCS